MAGDGALAAISEASNQDPNFSELAAETREIEAAVRASGLKIITVKAANEREIDAAFSAVTKSGAGALLVGADPLMNGRRS